MENLPSKPHGGELINRTASDSERDEISSHSREFRMLDLSRELAFDIENIATGVFSPLEGFLGEEDYVNILKWKRLADDTPWTIPILLDVSRETAEKISIGDDILLAHKKSPIALMDVEEKYSYDKDELVLSVFATKDLKHPGVAKVASMSEILLAGKIVLINPPETRFSNYKLTPKETRILFKERRWNTVVAFQTRNVPHIGHEYVQKTALTFVDGIFINPVIGRKKTGDFKDELILETYDALIKHYYLKENAVMAILQTEMRYAGPREAIFHAIVRKNFGCTHFIVGRDHAGVGNYYPPYAAQEIFDQFPDLGITPLFFKAFFYCKKCGGVANEKTCPHSGEFHIQFEGTKIREMMKTGEMPSEYLLRPEIARIMLESKEPFVTGAKNDE